MPAEVRGWDKVTKWVEREGVLGNGLWGPWRCGQGRRKAVSGVLLQHWGRAWVVGFGGDKGIMGFSVSLPVSPFCSAGMFPVNAYWG